MCPLYVVAEGEEGVASHRDVRVLLDPLKPFLAREGCGPGREELLPLSVSQHVVRVVAGVHVNRVVAVGPLDSVHEWQLKHAGALAQPPLVGLVPGQAGAVDAALLSRAYSDGLPVLDVADGVGLGVFQDNQRDEEIVNLFLGQVLVLGDDVLEAVRVQLDEVVPLLEAHAEDLLALDFRRNIVLVHLDDAVAALLLCLEDFKRVRVVAGGDDAVGDFLLYEEGRRKVAVVGQGDEVPEGGHPVRTAGTGIGAGERGKLRSLIDEVNFLQYGGEGLAASGPCGGHVLE